MDSSAFYRGRNYGPLWACDCKESNGGATVGCHEGTTQPLGRLANKELRQAKVAAHSVFDPLWKRVQVRDQISKHHARGRAYKWLAEQMGIPFASMHIGRLDVEQCRRVVEICSAIGRRTSES